MNATAQKLRAVACIAGCGRHFFPANPGDQICESSECAKIVQSWERRYGGKNVHGK